MEAIVDIDYLIQIVKEMEERVSALSVDARFLPFHEAAQLGRSVLVLKYYLNDVRNGLPQRYAKDIWNLM